MKNRPLQYPHAEHGAALIVSLILLLVISIVGVTGVTYSTNELRMAINEEARVDTFERAQSMIEATQSNGSNLAVIGNPGYSLCSPSWPPPTGILNVNDTPYAQTACTRTTVGLNPALSTYAADWGRNDIYIQALRLAPALSPPPRGFGWSIGKFAAANFGITAVYDRIDQSLGQATITQGVMVLVPL